MPNTGLLTGCLAVHSHSPPGPGPPPRNGRCDTGKRLQRRTAAALSEDPLADSGRWNTTESWQSPLTPPLTKDQDEERVQRHHPEHVFLGDTHTHLCQPFTALNNPTCSVSEELPATFKGGFLEPGPAGLSWDLQTCWKPNQSALTKNTKEPSRPNIWDRDKEQCHIQAVKT